MLVLAHRGANRLAPENSVAACVRALELGADGVEIDVRRTADRAVVVRHDAEVAAGRLSGLPLAVAREAVPTLATLEEVLDACQGALVNIEIKNLPEEPDWDRDERATELVVDLLARRGSRDDVLVSSRSLAAIDRVRTLVPTCPTGWVVRGRVDPMPALATVESRGHSALHLAVASLEGPMAETVTRHAHASGIRLNPWTVNDDDEVCRLADVGVDGVITDVPDAVLRVLGR